MVMDARHHRQLPRYDEYVQKKVPYPIKFKRSQPVLAVRGIQQAVCINLYTYKRRTIINQTRQIFIKEFFLWGWGLNKVYFKQ